MRVGSLCSGYGGLDAGWLAVAGGRVEWVSEIDGDALTVLGGVPNVGDLTEVDWAAVPPVDVLTAGYPCQPFSHAGSRKGEKDDRHLWPHIARAIGVLRPGFVFLENVQGHLSLGFADVLGDLARLGFDARWCVVRASDVGAPHQRARLFVLAYPASWVGGEGEGWGDLESERSAGFTACPVGDVADAGGERHGSGERSAGVGGVGGEAEGGGRQARTSWEEFGAGSVEDIADIASSETWGKYEPAIRRWEQLTRPAPPPTVPGDRNPRLNPVFVEWMMGLPEGHVTGHGLKHNACLRLLGNGVVPQQAALALRHLMGGAW